jgi:hypothetical protein
MIKQRLRVPAFAKATARQARFRVKKDLNTQTPLLEMRGGVFDLIKAKSK